MNRMWEYFTKKDNIQELYIANGQYMAGHILGIILPETDKDYSDMSIRNARQFECPVRYEIVNVEENKNTLTEAVQKKINRLCAQGCRGIILAGDEFCGCYKELIAKSECLLLVSILQILPFATVCCNLDKKICIISDSGQEEILCRINELDLGGYVDKCVFADTATGTIRDITGASVSQDNVGGIILDTEDLSQNIIVGDVPVYTYKIIAKLLKMGLVQVPHEGWI